MSSKARLLLKQIKNSRTTNNNIHSSTPSNPPLSSVPSSPSHSNTADIDPLLFLSQYSSEIEPLDIDELLNDETPPQHSSTTKACGMKSKFFTKQLLLNQSSCDEEDNGDSLIIQCPLSTTRLPSHKGIMFKKSKRMKTHRDKVDKMKEKYVSLHSFSEKLKNKFVHNANKYGKVERVVDELMGIPTKVIEDEEVQEIGRDNDTEVEIVPRRKLDLLEIEMLMS